MLKFPKSASRPAVLLGLALIAAGMTAGPRQNWFATQTIGSTFQISETGPPGDADFDAFRSALTYNAIRDEFFVAWHGETSPGIFEIFTIRLDGAGRPVAPQTQLTNDARESRVNGLPEVVFNADRNEYLVVWNRQDPAGQVESQLVFTILNADGSTRFPNFLQLTTEREFEGGVSRAFQRHATYNPDDGEYLVVWSGEVAPGEFEILGQRIDAVTGFPTGPDDAVLTATGAAGDAQAFAAAPRVAYNSIEKEFFLVFDSNPEGDDVEVYGLRLDPRLKSPISAPTRISSAGLPGDSNLRSVLPDLAFNPELNEYLVVWQAERFPGEFEIFGRVVDGVLGLPRGEVFPISETGPLFQSEFDAFGARVSLGDEAYLVVWEGEDSIVNKFEIHGQLIDRALGSEVGADDFQISRTEPETSAETIAAVAALAYSPTLGQFLATWHADGGSPGEFEIFGALVGGSPQGPDARFSPQLTVDIEPSMDNELSGDQLVVIGRSSQVFLDQSELPLTRTLRLDRGFLNLDELNVGGSPILTEVDVSARIGGQTMSIASGKITYVVTGLSEGEALLRGVLTDVEVSPTVLAMAPARFSDIAQQLTGFPLVEATLLRDAFGGGFIFRERFNTGDRVSSDYQGFETVLTTVDRFAQVPFRTFPGRHRLGAASGFVSRRDRLSAVFSSEFEISGETGPSIAADPNPIQVCSGQVGRTTIRWNAPGDIEVRAGSPEGPVFVSGSNSGESETGDWVRDGLEFFLVSAPGEATPGEQPRSEIWGRVEVRHTSEGCPLPDRFSFAQFGDGEGLSSRILLIAGSNSSQTPVELDFRDPMGAPLEVELDGRDVQGRLRETLPPGGLLALSTDGAGPLLRGSVEVASELDLSGALLFDGPFGFAGVPAAAGSSDGFVAPIQTDPAGINTGLAIRSLEESPVDVDLILRDAQGTELAESRLRLEGSGQTARFVDEILWNPAVDLTRFVGSVAAAAGPSTAAVAIQTRPGEFATLPTVRLPPVSPAQGVAERELFFAHFADGLGEIFTQIVLLNPSAAEASATLALRDQSGGPARLTLNGQLVDGGMDVQIPAGSALILESDSSSDPPVQGSVQVTSATPIGGAVLFGGPAGVAGVGASSPSSAFAVPATVSSAGNLNMGLAIAGATDSPAQLELFLKDVNGAVVAGAGAALPPRGQFARFIGEFDWTPEVDFANFEGVLEVRASGGVVATALLTRPGQFATLPVSSR